MKKYGNRWTIGLILISTFLIYFNSLSNNFIINWDDHLYVTENNAIKELSWNGIKGIFTSFHYENYHPLTNLSNAVEYKFFQLNPFPYHLNNLLLHLANTILVFLFIYKLSGRNEVAFVVALLFGIHPMHVESVAWISERKDLLYSFFYLSSLVSYLHYLERVKSFKYLIYAFLLFIGSCLSKSAAVSLPLVMILIDYYKTNRIEGRRLLEKIPFVILSLVFGIVALLSQASTGATTMVRQDFDILEKIMLTCYALDFYIVKLFLPFNLSALYLYPEKESGSLPILYYLAPLLIISLLIVIFKSKRLKKDLVFGFLFFFFTIALMIQIIPVGRAIVAERYSYIAYIGLFFIVGQAYSHVHYKWKNISSYLKYGFVAFVILLSALTFSRNKVWKDGEVLFTDMIKKSPENALAYYNRGYLYQMGGKHSQAIKDFDLAIKYDSAYGLAYNNRGGSRFLLKDYKGAIEDYDKAIIFDTINIDGYYNRAYVKQTIGDIKGALDDYAISIIKRPNSVASYANRGTLKQSLKDYNGAIADFSECIKINPEFVQAYFNRGNAYYNLGKDSLALLNYKKAISLKPDYADACFNAGVANVNLGNYKSACDYFKMALKLNHANAAFMINQHCPDI